MKKWLCVAIAVALVGALPVEAAREAKTRDAGGEMYAARRLLRRAGELIEMGERERGVKMLETIVRQYPTSRLRFEAYLMLGRNYFETFDHKKAVEVLRNLQQLQKEDEDLTGDDREMYLEAMYLTGVCQFRMRQYPAAFAALRRITSRYPNTVWANQSYYYIGMAHFAQEHWNKAIKALSLVGTFIDPESPAVEYVEAGHRLHVKIEDADLPILHRLKRTIRLKTTSSSGDSEEFDTEPLAGNTRVFLGSISTEVGVAKPGDGILQITGGDDISVEYVDDNTKEGEKDVVRVKTVKVVSSATVQFTMGNYESKVSAAFLAQPVFMRLRDVDLDTTDQPDTATLTLLTRYRAKEVDLEAGQPALTVDLDRLMEESEEGEEEKKRYETRDSLKVKLTETGPHTGIFTGSARIERVGGDSPASAEDEIVSAMMNDQLVAFYTDARHAKGEMEVEVSKILPVVGEVGSAPMVSQNVISDPLLRARKELVEAEAYLELARIFKSMGLMKGAQTKSEEGLSRVKFALTDEAIEGTDMREKAFELKWNLYLAYDNLPAAMATCRVFNRLYPESPLVDNALMGIGKIYLEKEDLDAAVNVFKQVLALPNSMAKAEAQFLIAEVAWQKWEAAAADPNNTRASKEGAIAAYRQCAKRYPDSPFAGRSLGKVVDYHVETRDYVQADDLLNQIFMDYQDETFLDAMLLKWVLVAYRTGDYGKAQEKCSQLIFEYPGSIYAKKAKQLLPKIEAKLGSTGGTS
jgi:outer membrane protein assembly factor BamD (BamD/ComL family)